MDPITDLVRRVYQKEGKLYYHRGPGNENELAPIADDRFLMVGARGRVELTFKPSRPGAALQMSFKDNDAKPTVWEMVRPAAYKPDDLAEFSGEYHSAEVGSTYKIAVQGDKLLLSTGNWGNFALTARFVDSFANPEEMGSLVFTRDQRKRVNGFVIRSGKVRNLTFNKLR